MLHVYHPTPQRSWDESWCGFFACGAVPACRPALGPSVSPPRRGPAISVGPAAGAFTYSDGRNDPFHRMADDQRDSDDFRSSIKQQQQ